MTNQPDLLPCPFCGSKAIIRTHNHYMPTSQTFSAECSACYCKLGEDYRSGEWFGYYDTPEDAARVWNTRISPAKAAHDAMDQHYLDKADERLAKLEGKNP